jgi:hypothetical protein
MQPVEEVEYERIGKRFLRKVILLANLLLLV